MFPSIGGIEKFALQLSEYVGTEIGGAPAISRFLQIDPMAEERDWLTPYNYVQNNPIIRIDKDGMLDDIVINGDNGYSVTIETDLIDIEVNAGALIGDIGGNYTLGCSDIPNWCSFATSTYLCFENKK